MVVFQFLSNENVTGPKGRVCVVCVCGGAPPIHLATHPPISSWAHRLKAVFEELTDVMSQQSESFVCGLCSA